MTTIQDFAAAQADYNKKMSAIIDDIKNHVDVLTKQVASLQSSPGQISKEDQATLDDLTNQSSQLADKLTALDNLNPPQVPQNPTA